MRDFRYVVVACWVRFWVLLLMAGMLGLVAPPSVAGAGYTRNDSSLTPVAPDTSIEGVKQIAPIEIINEMVRIRAAERWERFAIGTPIPAVNDDGRLVCYHVPVMPDADTFPEVLSAPPADELDLKRLGDAKLWGNDTFWTFWVSASQSDYPVFTHGPGLPPLLVTYHKAFERARELLDTDDVELVHYISLGHPGDFYRFRAPDGTTARLHAYRLTGEIEEDESVTRRTTMDDEPSEPTRQPDADFRRQVDEAWAEVLESLEQREDCVDDTRRSTSVYTNKYNDDRLIPHVHRVENFEWIRGCTPTAAASVLSYYNGGSPGYQNLIQTYRRQWSTGHEKWYDGVPDLIDRLANAMGTSSSGSTYVGNINSGIRQVARDLGYEIGGSWNWGCSMYLCPHNRSNLIPGGNTRRWNYSWNYIRDIIRDNNRPFVWSPTVVYEGHSLAAVGYNSGRNKVIVIDSNRDGLRYWRYNVYEYDSLPCLFIYVSTVVPREGYSAGITLVNRSNFEDIYLVGGETYTFSWYHHGDDAIKTVDILLSHDRGRTWDYTLASDIPTSPGRKNRRLTLPKDAGFARRLRIIGYDADGVQRASDSTREDFAIQRNTHAFTMRIDPPEVREEARWRAIAADGIGSTEWTSHEATNRLWVGDYTIKFKPLDSYETPPDRQLTIPFGHSYTRASYVPSGSRLHVPLEPPDAIAAGAQWRVKGGFTEWMDSGAWVFLEPGLYTVEFKDLPGWYRLDDVVVDLTEQGKSLSREYAKRPESFGSLRVNLYPPAVRAEGARWRHEGTDRWFASGEIAYGLPEGNHTLEFSGVADWVPPPGKSVYVKPGFIASDASIASAIYVPHMGGLHVDLPTDQQAEGARWRIAGTEEWLDPNTSIENLPVGWYEVEFKPIESDFWTIPDPFIVEVENLETATNRVSYVPIVGALRVVTTPLRASMAGARWRIEGSDGDWLRSGDVLGELVEGDHTVEFLDMPGWDEPTNEDITIVRHETAEVVGAYTAQDLTELCEALANCDLTWALGGDAEWFAQSTFAFEGKTAAQSGPIANGEESWIQTGVEGPGTLRFHWAVGCRDGVDGLRFSTSPILGDFTIRETITGEIPSWEKVVYEVPEGHYLLRWTYVKNAASGHQKPDAGWLDRVRWLPDGEELPDLAVTDSHAAPLTVARGETVNLSATIENLGVATAEVFHVLWYLALDDDMDETFMVAGHQVIETLAPDAREDWTDAIWTVPIDMTPGTYYLAAHVDPAGEIADSNPFNNRGEVFEVTITEEQRLPDLAITQFSVTPALLEPGDTLTIEATVQNEGDADAPSFFVHWYTSRDPHVPPDITLGYTRISHLEPGAGEHFAYDIPWTTPADMEGGTYYLMAVADTDDDVYESNTNNNRGVVHQVYVQAEPPPPVTAGQLVTWGRQTTPNAPLRNIVALDAGPWHSMALTMDGGIIAWGRNFYGQTVPPSARDYVAIAAGGEHGIALRQDGSLVGWGWDILDQASPPAGNDYVAVAAGDTHSLALRADGSIIGWGDDFDGQASAPEGTNFVAIAAGGWHSLALRDDGSIYCWGNNDHGQATAPEGTNFVAIAAGVWHSMALRDDGSIYCWGNHEYGLTSPPEGNQFIAIAGGREHAIAMRADGTLVGWGNDDEGQASPPPGGTYVGIAAGNFHSLALRADGTLVGWGNNWEGQSEPPTGSDYKAVGAAFPTYSLYLTSEGRIRGVGQYLHADEQPQTAGHQAVAAGSVHALALREQGTIVGWGVNDHGQLDIPDVYDFVAIAAAANHSLALRKNGSIVGWGDNFYGQVSTPVGAHYTAIATGHGHSMALHEDGSIYCWGNNDDGQVSSPPGNDFAAIAAGGSHSLALREDGSIAGWGYNTDGQAEPPPGNDFVAIAAGWDHSLALRSDGSIAEWGATYWTGNTSTPTGNDFIAIDAGQFHSVALRGVPAETWTLYVQEPQGEGTTSPAAGTGRLGVGRDALLNATPETGWNFSHWLINDMFAGGMTNFAVSAGEADEIVVMQAVFTDGTRPPVALDNAYRVQRNQPLHVDAPGVLENDYDPHGTALSAILVEQPRHGTLTLNDDGSFTYSPDTDYAGLDTFIYEAYAGEKRSAPATVLLSVQTYTVTYTAGTGGRIVGETEQVIAEGESGSVVEVVVEDPGAVFAHWSDGTADPLRTDTNVTSDLNVTVRFRSKGGADLGWYASQGIAPEPGEDWTDVDDRPVEDKGTTLLHENIADTDPSDPTDTFRILNVIPGPPLEVTFRPGSPDRVYILRASYDLAEGSWTNVPDVGPRRGSGTPTDTFTDDAPCPQGLFYHVEVELP